MYLTIQFSNLKVRYTIAGCRVKSSGRGDAAGQPRVFRVADGGIAGTKIGQVR
jgi:hypothetical protein